MLINFTSPITNQPTAIIFENSGVICIRTKQIVENLKNIGKKEYFVSYVSPDAPDDDVWDIYTHPNPIKVHSMYMKIIQAYVDGDRLFNVLDLDD